MSILSLKGPLHPHETLASYCSRIAAMNGMESATEFASHFGFNFGRLVDGYEADIGVFSRLVGSPQDNLTSGVVIQTKGFVKTYGGTFSREFLDTDRCRFCPACVATDIGPTYRPHRAYGRVEWMLKFIHTCPDHGIGLSKVSGHRLKAADFSAQLRTRIDDLERLARKQSSRRPMRLQNYVINRLRGGEPEGIWLDEFPLQAAAHFTQLLGAMSRDGREPDLEEFEDKDWIEVAEIGFDIVSRGRQAVETTLEPFFDFKTVRPKVSLSMLLGRLPVELLERSEQPGYRDLIKFLENAARWRHPTLMSELPN